MVDQLRAEVGQVLGALELTRSFVDAELAEMVDYRLAKTTNRSVLGMVNEFVHLSEAYQTLYWATSAASSRSRLTCRP